VAQARTWTQEIGVQLPWFLELVEAALPSLEPDPGGRPRDAQLHLFIKRLCFIYQWATGKPPGLSRQKEGKPAGPLFRFICTCLTLLTPHSPLMPHWGEACNAQALFEQIKTVLTLAKKKPGKQHRS